MTRAALNAKIASYTISNSNYMRNGGVNNGSYNCNLGEGNTYSFKSYLGIPSSESILSFFDIGILSSGEKGLAFTDKGVYGRDRFGSTYHYLYENYYSFNEPYCGFCDENVQDIMHDIYVLIQQYETEQYQIAKRNDNIKKAVKTTGTIAAILAGLSAAWEKKKKKSAAVEENTVSELLKNLDDILNL